MGILIGHPCSFAYPDFFPKAKKKALGFPPRKGRKKNRGNFLLTVVGDAVEAKRTPKGGFMQPGATFPLGLV